MLLQYTIIITSITLITPITLLNDSSYYHYYCHLLTIIIIVIFLLSLLLSSWCIIVYLLIINIQKHIFFLSVPSSIHRMLYFLRYAQWVSKPAHSTIQCLVTVGTGGSPKNWSVWWCKCNKTLLFTVFSAHTQIAFMLMLREHMPCLFATRGRFLMTFLDTFSSQHIETA